jgi:hypothetical protein
MELMSLTCVHCGTVASIHSPIVAADRFVIEL